MKKIISIAFAAILVGLAISCQKEEAVSDKTDAVQYTFNITVADQVGFDSDVSTKKASGPSYKSDWGNGDRIFLFFKPTSGSLLGDRYATLSYNGSSWGGTVSPGTSNLGDGGTLSAVYVYNLDSSVDPEFSDNKWTIATGNTFYNCQTGVDYTVSGSEISASLNLVAPDDFVCFSIYDTSGDALTCNNVKGWKDVVIGSEMTFSNATCTGYMTGFDNIGGSNYKDYYGRIVGGGTSLNGQTCNFSVVKDGKVYERSATPLTNARSFSMNTKATDDKKWTEAAGKLPGLFTVGKGTDGKAGTEDDVQVRFSKGNLYAKKTGDNWNWGFYDEQYEFLAADMAISGSTEMPQRIINENETEIDLFTWGYGSWSTSPTTREFLTDHEYEPFSPSEDWGNTIDDKGTWRTLTKDEWCYLFAFNPEYDYFIPTSPRYNLYKTGVTVCGKANCVVLLPDNWDETVISLTNFAAQNTYDESSNPKWSKMQAAGAVCLPAAGDRSGSSVYDVGDGGDYWSSTAYDKNSAYDLHFDSGPFRLGRNDARNEGFSVRLITKSN